MKSSRSLMVLALLVVGGVVCGVTLAQSSEGKIPPERFEAKVLKAYVAKDGDAIFRAYAVRWKGQEVIASDALAGSDYHEGDTISVLAMNHPFPQNKEPRRLLAFVVVPQPRARE